MNTIKCNFSHHYTKHIFRALVDVKEILNFEIINNELFQRWYDRQGKAIHSKSDFDRELITWDDRANESKIIKL
jgi:Asp-tRNA(Asn)/Glu-tRNA(Gln) amidotransferase B subunit